MINFFQKTKAGFTIIEVMIATALFTVIMVVGVGTLLNANDVHKQSTKMRAIVDNLNFILGDMSRNLRTGTDFACGLGSVSSSPTSCPLGSGIGGNILQFKNADGQVIEYAFVDAGDGTNNLEKIDVGTGATSILNPVGEISIDPNSGFFLNGAEPAPGNVEQPYIIIKLSGKIHYKTIETPFALETSVSQRFIDVAPLP